MIEFKPTQRGFARAEFRDAYDTPCSLQKSSLADTDCIWLGVDTVEGKPARMHLTQEQVKALLPHLKRFVKTGELALFERSEE